MPSNEQHFRTFSGYVNYLPDIVDSPIRTRFIYDSIRGYQSTLSLTEQEEQDYFNTVYYTGNGEQTNPEPSEEREMPHTTNIWSRVEETNNGFIRSTIPADMMSVFASMEATSGSTMYSNAMNPLEINSVTEVIKDLKLMFEDSMHFDLITIAGGAPRDMYMSTFTPSLAKKVRDIDVYVRPTSSNYNSRSLTGIGFNRVYRLNSADYESEEQEGFIESIYEAEYRRFNVNIIVTYNEQATTEDVINSFCCSLSKFHINLDTLSIVPNNEALLSIATKTIIFDGDSRDNYKDKIMGYYPTFNTGTFQSALFKLLDEELNTFNKNYHLE